MKYFKFITLFFVLLISYVGCENVNEPINIDKAAHPAYVAVSDTISSVLEGRTDSVTFQLPVSIQEDANFTFSISGTAEMGTDWTADDENISADQGSGTITYVDSTSSVDESVINISFPKDGVKDGDKTLTFTLQSAQTASGDSLDLGQNLKYKSKTFHIVDFETVVSVETGTYSYKASGDLGSTSGTLTISKPDQAVVSNGTKYSYMISDIGAGAFQSKIPYPFSVRGTGVFIAPTDYIDSGFADKISGSYDQGSGTIIITPTLILKSGTYNYKLILTPVSN